MIFNISIYVTVFLHFTSFILHKYQLYKLYTIHHLDVVSIYYLQLHHYIHIAHIILIILILIEVQISSDLKITISNSHSILFPLDPELVQLKQDGFDHLKMSWRPNTWKRYQSAWNRFKSFCILRHLDHLNCSIQEFIAFTQSLVDKGLASNTIKNVISAIRTMCRWHDANHHLWKSDLWDWNLKSLELSIRKPQKEQSVVTFTHFQQAVNLAQQLHWPHVQLSFILGFLGLLRISNIVPESDACIDKSRDTLLGDLQIKNDSLLVKIKWAKNMQTGSDMLTLPSTRQISLCPVQTWNYYFNSYLPQGIDLSLPLLLERHDNVLVIIDQCALRKYQHKIWHLLNLQHMNYTSHSLRRGGATFFADQGLPLDEIKKLGMWRSNAIQVYLRKLNFEKSQLFNFVRTI